MAVTLPLVASTLLEAFAGASLLLRPAPFIRRLYGRDPDALTVKFARTSGVALLSLALLSALCVAGGAAPREALLTLLAYHVGAAANNWLAAGPLHAATLAHAVMAAAFVQAVVV